MDLWFEKPVGKFKAATTNHDARVEDTSGRQRKERLTHEKKKSGAKAFHQFLRRREGRGA